MDRGLWQATVYEVAKEYDMTEHNHLVVSLFLFKRKFDRIKADASLSSQKLELDIQPVKLIVSPNISKVLHIPFLPATHYL